LISKKGKDGLKRRIVAFDSSSIRPAVITRAKEILRKYDMESVQIASAGAATFYLWVSGHQKTSLIIFFSLLRRILLFK